MKSQKIVEAGMYHFPHVSDIFKRETKNRIKDSILQRDIAYLILK